MEATDSLTVPWKPGRKKNGGGARDISLLLSAIYEFQGVEVRLCRTGSARSGNRQDISSFELAPAQDRVRFAQRRDRRAILFGDRIQRFARLHAVLSLAAGILFLRDAPDFACSRRLLRRFSFGMRHGGFAAGIN